MIFLFLVSAHAQAAFDQSACNQKETWQIIDKISAYENSGIISDLIADENLSLSCRWATLKQIKNNAQLRSELGLCQPEECQNLYLTGLTINEILLNIPINKATHLDELINNPPPLWTKADQLLKEILTFEMSAVTQKYRADQIPSCIGPESCKYGHPRCLNDLSESWLNGVIKQPGFDYNELWIDQGSFLHLFLGEGLTCGDQNQIGGTCVLYSGASLMSHYCYEAQTADGFAWTPPTCLTPQEFLQSTFQNGRWRAALCYESAQTHQMVCEAATDNPRSRQDALLNKRFERAAFRSKTSRARRILERQTKIAHQSAQEYLGEKITDYPNAVLTGSAGLTLEDTLNTYKQSNFKAILRPATPETWETLLSDLKLGHPAQISVDNEGWVNSQSSAKSTHAVTLEGFWDDGSGKKYVLIRDPNDFQNIKIFPEIIIKKQFIDGFFGATSLCSTNDTRAICQQTIPK